MVTSNFANNSNFPLLVFDELDSTNSYLKELLPPVSPWTTVRALAQTSGRGRFNRTWEAVPFADLTFSTILPPHPSLLAHLPSITPIVGWSILTACRKIGVEAMLKWPNDILVGEKKLAGILVEVITQGEAVKIIVGVGININSHRATKQNATSISLYDVLGEDVAIEEFLSACVEELKSSFAKFVKEGFSAFVAPLNAVLAWKGEWRSLCDGALCYQGYIEGVGLQGELLFREGESGGVLSLISGELSFKTTTP